MLQPLQKAPLPRWFWGAVALSALVSFWATWSISTALDRRGVYNDWDIWFASDPNWYLPRLADGIFASKRHPLLHVMASPVAWYGAKAVKPLIERDEGSVRRQVVLSLLPIAAGAKTVFLFLLLARLKLPTRWIFCVAAMDATSLSNLVFGGIPESYGATAAGLMWMFYLTADALQRGGPLRSTMWFACGLFATGVTLTNIVPFALLLVVASRPDLTGWYRTAKRAAVMSLGVLFIAALLYVASLPFLQPDPRFFPESSGASVVSVAAPVSATSTRQSTAGFRETASWMRFDPIKALQNIPKPIAWSFVAPFPLVIPTQFPSTDYVRSSVRLDMEREVTRQTLLLSLLVTAVVGLGACGFFAGSSNGRWFGLGAIAILLFNAALFSIWGGGLHEFLYTLHWQPVLIALLAGLAYWRGGMSRVATGCWAVLAAVQIVWNLRYLQFAFRVLQIGQQN